MSIKAVLKFATTISGVQFVRVDLTRVMPELLAVKLGTLEKLLVMTVIKINYKF